MKKIVIIFTIIILVGLCAYGIFTVRGERMASTLKRDYKQVEAVDLSKIADGVYPGSYKNFIVAVSLEVVVKDHKLAGITIKDQLSGTGYEAKDMPERIIQAQSPLADVVSGATSSSKCIMIAVHKALTQK